jgi:hypothetical protein
VIFSKFCRFIAVPVITLPPPVSADRKTGFNVGLTQLSHDREALHYMECAWHHWLESDPKRTNDWWQRHDKTCFLTPPAGSWTIVTRSICTQDLWDGLSSALAHVTWMLLALEFLQGRPNTCMHCMWMHCIQLAMHVDMVYNCSILVWVTTTIANRFVFLRNTKLIQPPHFTMSSLPDTSATKRLFELRHPQFEKQLKMSSHVNLLI